MTVFQRILRYLLLWLVLFVVLCVISVVRYWEEISTILSNTFSSYISEFLYIALLVGLVIYGLRLMIQPLTRW